MIIRRIGKNLRSMHRYEYRHGQDVPAQPVPGIPEKPTWEIFADTEEVCVIFQQEARSSSSCWIQLIKC